MNNRTLREVIECLTEGRKLVQYSEDAYAFYLLDKYCESNPGATVSQVKQSAFSKLMEKPEIKSIIAKSGKGKLSGDMFRHYYTLEPQEFVITLSSWGCKEDYRWDQTSRPGVNLVMQLNLTNQHDEILRDLKINGEEFKFYSHPIHDSKSSLSWARIDFDFDSGEALIEELQTDWIRRAAKHNHLARKHQLQGCSTYFVYGDEFNVVEMLQYTGELLNKYQKSWMEVTLFYAIELIKEEIGIGNIFYHSYETGAVVKNISGTLPPRSLYTQLPKKFCFTQCKEGPGFIMEDRKAKRRLKKAKNASWFKLAI
ncbi:MAG: hypothetical protein OQJ89_10520 [Kangiellaceae bacterium]|nr:hypothetical protein [Kangiellaceae bacterium]MCW8999119.1 hypothetical protein [Kangiellaceae bacterium]MCW9017389.1 hypothetical protein [Kangiellaceae bacterium]